MTESIAHEHEIQDDVVDKAAAGSCTSDKTIESTSNHFWSARTFSDELIANYARTRPRAILLHLVVLLPIVVFSMFGSPNVTTPAGAAVIGIALALSLFFSDRWLFISSKRTVYAFISLELIEGLGWTIISLHSPIPEIVSSNSLLIFVSVVLGGSALAFSVSLRGAMLAQIGPLMISDAIAIAYDQYESFSDSALSIAILLFFLHLAGRIAESARDHLEIRAEKDALIADLEQAKAHSDEARRRAEELNRAKSQFLATMSHELRTPLNAILGFSEIMEAEMLGRHRIAAYRGYAHDIHESGRLLLTLIDEVLDLSRIEAGRYELTETQMRLDETVTECAHLVQLRTRSRNISMTLLVDPALPPIVADKRALRQITLNLLSNALKFTPPGGDVTLRVGKTPIGGQFIQVTDTGPGIPEHEIPIILENFGRGSLAVKTAEQGSGLGLPIVRGLVAMHGGEFLINSRENDGTSVTITLPVWRTLSHASHSAEYDQSINRTAA